MMIFFWFQECKGEKIPNTDGRSKVDVTPLFLLDLFGLMEKIMVEVM